jgi:hypothetical protein
MDPFLEHPAVFPGLHNRLIAALSELLQAKLPAPYYAEIGERIWVEVSERFIEPDTTVLRREPSQVGTAAATTAAATRSRPVVVTVPHDERRESFIEIRVPGEAGERLVTAIEVLSLSNKTPGERGRDLYQRKQRELLESQSHLIEIDLLRAGQHTTAVPFERLSAQVGVFDYHVSVHRSERFEEFLVYPIRLEEPLPEIAVPLLPGDGDVPADLQEVFNRAYDSGPYVRRIRYAGSSPVPPLRPEQGDWAARILHGR